MKNLNVDIERKKFQEYIFDSWESSKHNFSMDDRNQYVYRIMQDAWEVWRYAREMLILEMERYNERRKEK
jgi:hypothetical protein